MERGTQELLNATEIAEIHDADLEILLGGSGTYHPSCI